MSSVDIERQGVNARLLKDQVHDGEDELRITVRSLRVDLTSDRQQDMLGILSDQIQRELVCAAKIRYSGVDESGWRQGRKALEVEGSKNANETSFAVVLRDHPIGKE